MSDFWLEKGTSSGFRGNVNEATVTVQGEFSYFINDNVFFFHQQNGFIWEKQKITIWDM